ncbi:MAG: histidine kinase dimerization/phosphoacceptor domain -containing protein [Balneolaceae bacterium]
MRLGTKIIIGFVCISLLLVVVGLISDRFTDQVRLEQLKFVNEVSSVVIYTGEMEGSLYQSLIYLNAIRETRNVEADFSVVQELPAVKDLQRQFLNELEEFEHSFKELQSLVGGDDLLPEDINQLYKSYQVYKSLASEWLVIGEEDFEKANLMFIRSIETYFTNNIIPQISQLRNFVLDVQEQRNQRLNESLDKASIVNYLATFFSVFLAIILAVYIYRSIANPLAKLSETATRYGQGNLDERIEVDSKDEIGQLAKTFNEMAANLQKKTVSKAYLDNIIESIHEAIFVADADGNLSMLNSAAASLLGYEAEEMLNMPVEAFYDFGNMKEVYEQHQGNSKSFEFSLITKDRKPVPVLFSEAGLIDTQGNLVGTVAVASDISQRKVQEEKVQTSLREKEVMLAEIHHRVKNNLAVISGLLQLQSFNTENSEVEKALTDSQLRIQSIALVHEMLYESESLAYIKYDKYVNDLLQAISSMHTSAEKEIKLVSNVEPVMLSVNQAIPCSLLLNELIVNSYKHAFEGVSEGEIVVDLEQEEDYVTLTISDTGNGFDLDKFNDSKSLGATLIKTLTSQLKGEFEIIANGKVEHTKFRVSFTKEG